MFDISFLGFFFRDWLDRFIHCFAQNWENKTIVSDADVPISGKPNSMAYRSVVGCDNTVITVLVIGVLVVKIIVITSI